MRTSTTRNTDLRIRVSPEERRTLDRAAEKLGLGTSSLVRAVIRDMIRREELSDIQRLAESRR